MRARPLAERLAEHLVPEGDCLVYDGCRNSDGYGRIGSGGKHGRTVYAHRAAYELVHGPLPEGVLVLHTCDNPPCCNVEHLFPGTKRINALDQIAKGRPWSTGTLGNLKQYAPARSGV